MEAIIKVLVQLALIGLIFLIVLGISVRLSKKWKAAAKEKEDKQKADILAKELAELDKWKVPRNETCVINGRLEMSIHAMVTLIENPDYIKHLREESIRHELHENFFEHQLEIRINKAKLRIQDRINRLRIENRNKNIDVNDRLKSLGIE